MRSWVSVSYTHLEDGIPFAENTELRGEILLCPGVFGTDSFFCRLPDGDEVNFYQVIPLYREEIQYKLEHGSDALLDLCPDESLEVINPHRLNVVTDGEKISYDPAEMDNAAEQIKKIRALHLPVDELDAYNRMAFFLGWAMKRGQMSNPFLSRHREVVEAVWAGKGPDLRAFILNKLDGKLSTQFFDRRGSGFAQWYAPVSYTHLEDEVLGTLTLDREMSMFTGTCRWMGKEVQISLDVEIEKKASWPRATNVMKKLLADQEVWDKSLRAMAAQKDRKSTRLNSSHSGESRMPSSA